MHPAPPAPRERVELVSHLALPAADVWAAATDFAGNTAELRPWLRMIAPADQRRLPDRVEPGRRLFRGLEPGRRFLEQSFAHRHRQPRRLQGSAAGAGEGRP